ncbi:alpha/beta hydrolase family protein [Pseudomonas abietaniphila]|uniref:alpha/beta hydrolase family protein n=1 Tax=Pseudomonas abietaniphila TaxID=89065 RepID=UPI0007866D14|nr:S9 family peptidase [Pseudomonas abietaniphila]
MNETRASSPNPDLLSAAEAVAAGIDFAELSVSPAGLFWNEFRPQDAASRIWRWSDGVLSCLTPDGFSVRSRVYEYGGGSFCLTDDAVVFVNETDQQIYLQPFDASTPYALTQGDKRYGDVRCAREHILAVEEDQDVHRLVSIALVDGRREVLAEGADFYASPTLSPKGDRLVWIEWWRPHQPWTSTRLMSVERQPDGNWGRARCLAGGLGLEALQQPRFDDAGRLYCLTDRAGFWQPWVETLDGFEALPAAKADHAPAPWQLGGSSWLPLTDGAYLASWTENGTGVLGLRLKDGSLEDFTGGYARFRSLAIDDQYIYCIAASAIKPAAVVAINRTDKSVNVLAGGVAPLPAERISRPQALRYPSGNDEAHGYFYPAMNGKERPPLVVFVHGGPTSACYPVLDPRIQFWTQRGFAVADLNYRGSTGYGRAYRQALFLEWGVVDVEDACAVVEHLGERGLIDPDNAFIRGGSAGGYTTLCALAFNDVFRAGASLYGVSDPLALAEATHKFEADYLDWLIGDPDIDMARYRERTPLLHADRIKVPVIFFQGELDAVVVPAQTRDMLNALLEKGIAAEGHFYPEERHGFRKASNLAHALETEWAFYRKVMDS